MKAVLLQVTVVVCLCLLSPLSLYSQSQPADSYFQEDTDNLFLGNSMVTLRFDKQYGKLYDLKNAVSGTDFVLDAKNPSSFFLRYADTASKWEASHLQSEGSLVKGWVQALTGWAATYGSNYIELSLENKFTLGGGECTVTRKVKIFDYSPFTRWSVTIDNPTATGKTIAIIVFPHVRGLNVLGGDDYFISPQRRGERWEDFYFPRLNNHLRGASYPICSMQWMWYGNPREGLYYAAYDTSALPKKFRHGYDDRDPGMNGQPDQDEEMAMTHYPFLEPGGVWTSYEMEIGVKSGPGWYWGADRYREFIEQTAGWTRAYPDWAKTAHSIIRGTVDEYDQYDEVLQLTQWEGRGNHNMLDERWYRSDSSLYYWPVFKLDPIKGGFTGLQAGMQACHSQGDRVIYWANAYQADKDGTWYQTYGPGAAVINQYGQEVQRAWPYIPDKYFVDLCFWSDSFRDQVISYHSTLKDAGLDGVTLDSIYVFGEIFCYNPNHGHSSPAHAAGMGLVGLLDRLNNEVWRRQGEGTERLLSVEGVHDYLIPYVDHWAMHYMGGYQSEEVGERDYPEVSRYTLPGIFGALRQGDEMNGVSWPEASFAFGCKLDGPLWRDLTGYYNAYDAAPNAFYYGAFKADLGLTKSRTDFKALSFVSSTGDEVVVTLWNRGSTQQSIDIGLDLAELGIFGTVTGATDLMGRPLAWTGGATFTSTVPSDDVTAVRLGILLGQTPTPTITPPPTITPTPTSTYAPPPPPAAPLKLAVMKREGLNDINLYYYNCPSIGDMGFYEAQRVNPQPLARDFWVVPVGNDAIGTAAIELTGDAVDELLVLKREGVNDANLYLYNSLKPADWTFWDALARNPQPIARDLWCIPAGNDAVGIAAVDVNLGREEVAILRKDGGQDINLYIYNSPLPGDWTFWDAISRNPSPLARDLWCVPVGNDAIGLTALDVDDDGWKDLAIMKREGKNDVNLYIYNAPLPGDWTFWDAISRNPSPLARDLWFVPSGNDSRGVAAIDMDLQGLDELAVMKLENGTDMNIYFYNSPLPGDWTFWDAKARNPSPLARDLWFIPSGNDAVGVTAIRLE